MWQATINRQFMIYIDCSLWWGIIDYQVSIIGNSQFNKTETKLCLINSKMVQRVHFFENLLNSKFIAQYFERIISLILKLIKKSGAPGSFCPPKLLLHYLTRNNLQAARWPGQHDVTTRTWWRHVRADVTALQWDGELGDESERARGPDRTTWYRQESEDLLYIFRSAAGWWLGISCKLQNFIHFSRLYYFANFFCLCFWFTFSKNIFNLNFRRVFWYKNHNIDVLINLNRGFFLTVQE